MTFNSINELRKVSRWTDDLKKDATFYGMGSVSNQIHLANGTKLEAHSYEDRSFGYELSDGKIFAYGILDGYNGTWAVDQIEQILLTNVYFDHLQSLLIKNDEEINTILRVEFERAEQTLKENLKDLLDKRASLAFQNGELRKNTIDHLRTMKEINECDKQISSGSFAIVALIIENKLFVANCGMINCFVCVYDKTCNEKKVLSVQFNHNVFNPEEKDRLELLNADLSEVLKEKEGSSSLSSHENNNNGNNGNSGTNTIKKNKNQKHSAVLYTRSIGDFKLKLYFHEHPQFKDCTGPPLICDAQHLSQPILLDESFLFMVMYSDGLSKVLNDIYSDSEENPNSIIARMLISKMTSEQTLNSAAQSVLDEIKRKCDDRFAADYYEREDLTLIVRAFDSDFKAKLEQIENYSNVMKYTESHQSSMNKSSISGDSVLMNDSPEASIESSKFDSLSINGTNLVSIESNETEIDENESRLDENGYVKPYIDMEQLQEILSLPEHKKAIDELCSRLEPEAKKQQAAVAEEKEKEKVDYI